MTEYGNSRQDGQMEELLELLERMEQEASQKDIIIRQKDSEIRTLQGLNESLNLCEKLNSENRAENVQALKKELNQTKELLQREKEKKKRADSTIEECQDKLRQAEREKEYALTHQKKVEVLVEKPVLCERCKNCDRRAYQQAKERYEHQRNGLEKKYKAKTAGFDAMLFVLLWYAAVTTIFAAMKSEAVRNDFIIFVTTIWKGLCQYGKWTVSAGQYAAQAGDGIPNEMVATVVHWLLQIVVSAGVAGGAVVLLAILGRNVVKTYRENCRDVITVLVAVSSVAASVYFGNLIKTVININLIVALLLVQVVYVGIRVYVSECKRARGYD